MLPVEPDFFLISRAIMAAPSLPVFLRIETCDSPELRLAVDSESLSGTNSDKSRM